ncbi:putative pterin-binding protein [Hydrogenophaga aquatica]
MDAPQGRVILTITGNIGETNAERQAQFDLAMLEALPQHSFTTQTPWDNGTIKFTGPLLRDVLAAVKAQGSQLRAVALNDYRITIPIEDARRFDMVLAHRMNDQPIPIRTRGPLFIVYPFDSRRELRSNVYYERSIWQLKSLDID